MTKFIFITLFILKNLISQPNRWVSLVLFYITSFFIIGQLLSIRLNTDIIWTFYLLLQNFTVALLLKDVFNADVASQRLHYINRQPTNLMYFIVCTTLTYSILIFVIHLCVMPILCYLFQLVITKHIHQMIIWQACSALILTAAYLFGATVTQSNRMGVFFNLVTIMPLIIPWFLLSFEFLVNYDTQALLAVAALVLLLLPIMLYGQHSVLRSIIRF